VAHPLLGLQEGPADTLDLCGQRDEGAGEARAENQTVPLPQLRTCGPLESPPRLIQARGVCISTIRSLERYAVKADSRVT